MSMYVCVCVCVRVCVCVYVCACVCAEQQDRAWDSFVMALLTGAIHKVLTNRNENYFNIARAYTGLRLDSEDGYAMAC